MHSKYARNYLDSFGFRKTRSIIAEYNTAENYESLIALREGFSAEIVASIIVAQRSPVDMMFYSTSDITSGMNGLFSMDDYRTPHRYAAFQTAHLFSKLYRLGTLAETSGDYPKEIYSIAAFDKNEGGLLVVTRNHQGKIEIQLKGSEYDTCTVTKVCEGGERGRGVVYRSENIKINKVKFKATTATLTFGGAKVLVMKPQTFMNLSGEAVHEAVKFYKVPAERVLVIYDDVALPVGKIRVRPSGSAGGHNGIKNIIAHLGTDQFPRVKVGVGSPDHPEHEMIDWVIGTPSKEERKILLESLKKAVEAAECIIRNGCQKAMNQYN
jgi:PTH1 family peptidyl-tRNA hydrolase